MFSGAPMGDETEAFKEGAKAVQEGKHPAWAAWRSI
jgi:hypothetical protein